jgi:signal transduction histidine kinase
MFTKAEPAAASWSDNPEFQRAFAEHERAGRLQTGRLACLLVVLLMPVGVVLDYWVYPDRLWQFLLYYRLSCSFLVGGIWLLHGTTFGTRYFRVLQAFIVYLPAFFICLMIYTVRDQDPASRYYAGLNLILLAISAVGHWPFRDTLISVCGVIVMYLAVDVAQWDASRKDVFANNLYFLALTGVIVVAGNIVYNRLVFREFALRFELDQHQKTLAEAKTTLEETNRRLVELDRIKSRFFANISHELRTPLTLLLAPLETLLHSANRSFDAQTREWLRTMYGNGLRLLKLINDLLELVRLESGKVEVHRQSVRLHDFLVGLASEVRQLTDDKHVRLRVEVGPGVAAVMVDQNKLEKIVLNLLFNSVKFTPAGGEVELRGAREGDSLVVSVRDTGMGIPADQVPFLFQRFWQADASSHRKYQGAGIGLALVKELAEAQGGSVAVESVVEQGTTFRVHLPFLPGVAEAPVAEPLAAEFGAVAATRGAPAKATETEPDQTAVWLARLYRQAELFPSITPVQESLRPVETGRPDQRAKVLIADDEPDMLRFLRSQLVGDFQVLEAADGDQAIAKAAQFLPDILVCDMMMPEKDGLEVCRELRRRLPTQSLPILLITARADEETKLAALAAGASDFLSKPFSTSELNVRLRNLVRGYRYQRELGRQNQALEQTLEQLKEAESQLVASEKMASLGRLSAGIMHEMNNPLNFIKTNLFVLRERHRLLPAEAREDFLEMVGDLEDGVGRLQAIVAELRRFAHPHPGLDEAIEVDGLVGSVLRFMSHELKDGARVELDLAPGHVITGNRNKLLQVLINLVQNAVYAVRKRASANGEGTIRIASRTVGETDELTVRDNGVGIAPEHVSKIFEPFFTTKDVGEGLGLGLSICYRIIEEHGGRISVQSEPGQFTEFTLALPRKPL